MTLTRREKILIVAGAIIVAAALYLMYFLMPYLKSADEADKSISDTQTQLTMLNIKAAGVAKLNEEIKQLKSQLDTQWSSVPTGIDHARILLYLSKLTDGRAENVYIAKSEVDMVSSQPQKAGMDGPFLVQAFTLEFNTTYADFIKILDELKKNELFNRMKLISAVYQPLSEGTQTPAEAQASPSAEPSAEPSAAPTPAPAAVDANMIKVHMELVFYARQPAESEQPEPAMTPTNTDRTKSLMPED